MKIEIEMTAERAKELHDSVLAVSKAVPKNKVVEVFGEMNELALFFEDIKRKCTAYKKPDAGASGRGGTRIERK